MHVAAQSDRSPECLACDTDDEIEAVSQMTIPELFAIYGEQESGGPERRIIFRLLEKDPDFHHAQITDAPAVLRPSPVHRRRQAAFFLHAPE